MYPSMNSRKHRLSDDPGPLYTAKRVRLDTLLLNLSLDPDKPIAKPAKFSISSAINTEMQYPPQTAIDSYISEKMYKDFKDKYYNDLALIRWTLPIVVIATHFQRWVKRLFNAFVVRFNENNPNRKPVKKFTSYNKIIQLVQNPSVAFTIEDLGNILKEYNILERKKLALKRDKRADSKKVEEMHEIEQIVRESKYAYWDRFSDINDDVVMEDGIYELLDMETEMELDSPVQEGPLEANYGNYYGGAGITGGI